MSRTGYLALGCLLGCSLQDALNADGTSGVSEPGDSSTGQQADSAPADESGSVAPACGGQPVRVAAYNIESVGAVGSDSYNALGSTLLRLGADVVCVEEIADGEAVAFGELATAAGYPYALKADRSPAIGGEIANGCMARYPLEVVGSWGGAELSTDANANDVGRDFLAVRMDLSAATGEAAPCHLGLVAVHAKSGQEPLDWFRRQVEAVRLGQAVARYRSLHPDDAIVVMGDFNESLDDSAIGTVFQAAPAGLPGSYRLGSDIEFPLTYQPFAVLPAIGFELTSPGQEDAPEKRETWRDSVRLDYLWLSEAQWVGGEVYNACRDDGVDDAPTGDYMEKVGEPLACFVTELASDHFAVVADLLLP